MSYSIGGSVTWDPPVGMSGPVRAAWAGFYRDIFRLYGITPAQYRALYLAQSGRCFICRRASGKHPDDPKGGGGRRLGVDHNHALGPILAAIRGLLCTGGDKTCNRIIGWLSREALQRAAAYVADPPARQVLLAVQAGASDDELTGMVTG